MEGCNDSTKAAKFNPEAIADELSGIHLRYVYVREALAAANSAEVARAVANLAHEVMIEQNDLLEDLISRVQNLGEGSA